MAVAFMMTGLMGMSYYSAPDASSSNEIEYQGLNREESAIEEENERTDVAEQEQQSTDAGSTGSPYQAPALQPSASEDDQDEDIDQSRMNGLNLSDSDADGFVDEEAIDDGNSETATINDGESSSFNPETHQMFLGMKWKRRTLGILAAMIFTGIYGGSIMAPMKWAPEDAKGLGYLISFGIGASVVTMTLWIIRFLYASHRHQSFVKGYHALPSFHLRKMWLHGGTAGLLWSIGNFFSIIAIDYLGEGVGYSLVQSSILVSGLWGIFYFKEITGAKTIAKWFASAALTLCGIILLSYEHHAQ